MLYLAFYLLYFSRIDCNDNLDCTEDSVINGSCSNILKDGFCLIDNICYKVYETSEDGCGICLPTKNQYMWSDNQNDDLECTDDNKDRSGKCLHSLKKGFCLIEHRCIIDGTEDTNGCRKCDVSKNQYAWTIYEVGTPCNDGENCTKNDVCNADGECRGEQYNCEDDIPCTMNLCDGLGGCYSKIMNNYCLIEGQCIEDLSIEPGNDCKYCNVLSDQIQWTNVVNGTKCDDKDPSTPYDYCNGKGECIGYRTDPFLDAGNMDNDTGPLDSISDSIEKDLDIEREGCSCTAVY